MTLAARQALLAAFIDDPKLEARVRSDPAGVAGQHGVDVAFALQLAAIPPARVDAFRQSRAHKDDVRAGRRRARRADR